MNYDPNLNFCGRTTTQHVRLVFGQWEYRIQLEVDIGGNCSGFAVIDAAIDSAYEHFRGDSDYAELVMKRGEDCLIVADDEGREEEWLKDMLLGAEITSITPKEKPAVTKPKGGPEA